MAGDRFFQQPEQISCIDNDKAKENQRSFPLNEKMKTPSCGFDTRGDIRRWLFWTMLSSTNYWSICFIMVNFLLPTPAQSLWQWSDIRRSYFAWIKILPISHPQWAPMVLEHNPLSLFWLATKGLARCRLKQECQERKTKPKLKTLEELCGAQLSQAPNAWFCSWSHITWNNDLRSARQFQEIEQKMKRYTDNIFYQRLFRR